VKNHRVGKVYLEGFDADIRRTVGHGVGNGTDIKEDVYDATIVLEESIGQYRDLSSG